MTPVLGEMALLAINLAVFAGSQFLVPPESRPRCVEIVETCGDRATAGPTAHHRIWKERKHEPGAPIQPHGVDGVLLM